ncbi:hypothetical protein ASPZODRAFT_127828 [Penicilliopsis zonata CBS 506.65]|uniref:CFEM domain-containing protein n=1 Tax=Penicilliopsis zonata CBS 506.65 TaxID=1073090 RepID=A0A1L9SX38_9EURO|nr:hypothetical protein ASPZODRAFT_127828 [Penicilliopsis zonata CBS 506.65]OJJ51707.1 hypothetical protein ASPZODRAFT_127828 [Penicilliopsis zonata CBS 506.65]
MHLLFTRQRATAVVLLFLLSTTASAVSLSGTIPECALSCVDSFIESEYPTDACSDLTNVDCLCKTNTTSGFTLGEGAVRCVIADCSATVASETELDAYNICDSVAGALPRTHSTLTATVAPASSTTMTATAATTTTTTTTSDTSKGTSGDSTGTSLTAATATLSQPSSTQASSVSSTTLLLTTRRSASSTATASTNATLPQSQTSQTASLASTSTATSTASTVSSGGSHSLSKSAVTGISIASTFAGVAAIWAVVWFYWWRRRQRRTGSKHDSFEIGGSMSEPPDFGMTTPQRPIPSLNPSGSGGFDPETQRLTSPLRFPDRTPPQDHLRGNGSGSAMPGVGHDGVGINLVPDLNAEDLGDNSQQVRRLFPQLLPDHRPSDAGLYPAPLRVSQQWNLRPNSSATLFEEDLERPNSLSGPSNRITAFPGSTGGGNRAGSSSTGRPPRVGLPSNPRPVRHMFEEQQNPWSIRQVSSQPEIPPYREDPRGDDPIYPIHIHKPNQAAQPGQATTATTAMTTATGAGQSRSRDRPFSQDTLRRLYPVPPVPNRFSSGSVTSFDTSDMYDNTRNSRRWSRRSSGGYRPLTPVKEAVTPLKTTPKGTPERSPPYPRIPLPVNPPTEIVANPRIVRRDDIKQIHIPGSGGGGPSHYDKALPELPFPDQTRLRLSG